MIERVCVTGHWSTPAYKFKARVILYFEFFCLKQTFRLEVIGQLHLRKSAESEYITLGPGCIYSIEQIPKPYSRNWPKLSKHSICQSQFHWSS